MRKSGWGRALWDLRQREGVVQSSEGGIQETEAHCAWVLEASALAAEGDEEHQK